MNAKQAHVYLLMLLFLAFSPLVQAQLVFKLGGADNGSLSKDNYKYQTANEIYQRLAAARGDMRFPPPEFVLSANEKNGALMDYANNQIILEEKAYDVCTKFGTDSTAALAAILGHELIHHYEKHGWARKFASGFAGDEITTTRDTIINQQKSLKIVNETQADYLGGFLAYSAGYGVFDQPGAFIKGIYEAYGLAGNEPKDYPTLAEREEISKKSGVKVKELAEAFEMANMLAAVSNFGDARRYYKYILEDYQSREIFNNLGVLTVLEALEQFSELEMPFRLPLQLDLSPPEGSGRDGLTGARKLLLEEAIRYFDSAISLDNNYAPAYLNKACALALLEDYERAEFYAGVEAVSRAEKGSKLASDVLVLKGIIAAKNRKEAEAGAWFQQAIDANSALAEYNMKKLKGQPTGEQESLSSLFGRASSGEVERINGIDLDNYEINAQPRIDNTIAAKHRFVVIDQPTPQRSKILIHEFDGGERYAFFLINGEGYTGETARGIKIGSSREEVVAQYKAPENTIELTNGQLMAYKQLVFFLGPDNTVRKWARFKKMP